MIEYDKHRWTEHLLDIEGSMLREIIGRVSVCVAWSAVVVVYHHLVRSLAVSATTHTLVGVALGLLLVFRTNASYDRFWEGRKRWGALVNEARNLGRGVRAYIKGDPHLVDAILHWTTAFAYASKDSLRGKVGIGPVARRLPDPDVKAVLEAEHVPLAVALRISELLGSSVFKCEPGQKGPSDRGRSVGSARSSNRSLRTPDSGPGSGDSTGCRRTSGHTPAW